MPIIFEKSQKELAKHFLKDLKTNIIEVQISKYPNGEFRIDEIDINYNHILVLFPKFSNLNERLIAFFLMSGLCKKCKIIDVFIPYIPYSRQDKSSSFQLILDIIKFLKVRYIITLDIHKNNQDKFIINILPHEIYGHKFLNQKLVIVSPDIGAKERSEKFANYLKTDLVIIDKKNNKTTNLDVVQNRECLIIDDIIDSGKTLRNAIAILKKAGAKNIKTCITHDFKNL